MSKDQVIILAAGKGTRMNSDLPKVLVPLKGEAMIRYLLSELRLSGICPRPIIVVSPDNKEIIKEALKDFDCSYAIQERQLGTGHAFSCAKDLIEPGTEKLIGFYGDHPFVKKETIVELSKAHNGLLTMMSVKLPDFDGWHHNFYHWGRIVRDENGKMIEIKEFKDADEATREIKEVNPSFFCFNNDWFWENIGQLNNNNKQGEYYLTDMAKIAYLSGVDINTIEIDAREAMGVNSLEELAIAEKLIADKE